MECRGWTHTLSFSANSCHVVHAFVAKDHLSLSTRHITSSVVVSTADCCHIERRLLPCHIDCRLRLLPHHLQRHHYLLWYRGRHWCWVTIVVASCSDMLGPPYLRAYVGCSIECVLAACVLLHAGSLFGGLIESSWSEWHIHPCSTEFSVLFHPFLLSFELQHGLNELKTIKKYKKKL